MAATDYDLLVHGDVWDARNGRRPDHWVAVADGSIAAVGPERPGSADREIDAGVVTPGLIDMHVHLVWDGSGDPVATLRAESEQETTLRAVHNAREQLRGGVTTVRDVGSVADIAISVARGVRDGWVEGPRTYASGRTVIISGGHDPFWGLESDGPEACRAAVRQLRSVGADLVKTSATGGVYGQAVGEAPGASELSLPELEAIVDEAARFDLDVAAHAVGREGIANAIEAGVDTIEHGNLMDEASIERLAAEDRAYDPTLFVYGRIAEGGDGIPEYARRNANEVYEQHTAAFRRALDRGCRILAGSDAGSPGVPHAGLHLELERMVAEGMSDEAAMAAATLSGATELDRPELGVVEADTPADLACFDADPTEDVGVTESPTAVVADGDLVDGV